MTLSAAVDTVTNTMIDAKAQLRGASKTTADILDNISAVGDCEIVRAAGVQHVHIGEHRQQVAKAVHLIERAQAILCETHCLMKEQAEAADLELSPMSTSAAGGKR